MAQPIYVILKSTKQTIYFLDTYKIYWITYVILQSMKHNIYFLDMYKICWKNSYTTQLIYVILKCMRHTSEHSR